MLSEHDVKILRGLGTTHFRIVLGLTLLFAIFEAYFAYYNLSLALGYARAIDLDVQGTLRMWNAEPELRELYSGFEVQSRHRLNMAILSFGGVLFAAILAASLVLNRSHKKRVLAELECVGAIGVENLQKSRQGATDA